MAISPRANNRLFNLQFLNRQKVNFIVFLGTIALSIQIIYAIFALQTSTELIMSSQKYESGKLNPILQNLFKTNKNGILGLKTQIDTWQNQRSCILILQNGTLVYGEASINKIPSNKEVCQILGNALKPNLINAALSVARDRVTNPNSVRELTELLITMKLFSWKEAEAFVTNKVTLILEQFLPYPGEAKWRSDVDFDLSYGEDNHGLNWSDIRQRIEQRQQKWQEYTPTIPGLAAIPFVTPEQLNKIGNPDVKKHLVGSANGKNTLLDIADKMGKDPLKVAKSYVGWVENDWVSMGTTPREESPTTIGEIKDDAGHSQNTTTVSQSQTKTNNSNLPVVLSVDDSPIIQISIKRALQSEYNVLLASKAAEALAMLDQNPVQLMLLDLTMPDVDGLEFCKTVRQIPKFQDLPIVMVTARDGLVNKMKGHIAGTSKYLTKPFQPEQLREVVSEYINS